MSGGGYSGAKEREINAAGQNTGDGERGRHVHYRNTTSGGSHALRIHPGTCSRVEHALSPAEVAAMLVPGA